MSKFLIDVIVGHQIRNSNFIGTATYLGLLAQQRKAAHGNQNGVHVDAPKVQKEDDLQLDVGLLANGYLTAQVCVLLVAGQEGVPADQYLPQPFQYVGVVHYLVLDQLLGYGKEHLGTDIPESVYGRFGIPDFYFLWMVQY